jgi:hypothetical protein
MGRIPDRRSWGALFGSTCTRVSELVDVGNCPPVLDESPEESETARPARRKGDINHGYRTLDSFLLKINHCVPQPVAAIFFKVRSTAIWPVSVSASRSWSIGWRPDHSCQSTAKEHGFSLFALGERSGSAPEPDLIEAIEVKDAHSDRWWRDCRASCRL